MKLSAISYLLHIILQTYGYVDIDDGDQGLDWYDLWNEGSFKEAAQHWPEAPLSANYFADSLMFCREE